jgi:Barstar (barnase inhibitor)
MTSHPGAPWPGLPAPLSLPDPPWILRLSSTAASAYEASWRWAAAGATCRVLRGRKMRTEAGCFDELAAALQFPDYYGENWAATDECLADLSWLPGHAYVFVVTDADRVLDDEPPDRFAGWLDLLTRVAAEWAGPVDPGQEWHRAAIPMHVVLQCEPARAEALRARFGPRVLPPQLP